MYSLRLIFRVDIILWTCGQENITIPRVVEIPITDVVINSVEKWRRNRDKLIPLWMVEDVWYWFGVELAERCWVIRVNPYQGIRAHTQTSTFQRHDRGELHAYKRTYTRTDWIEVTRTDWIEVRIVRTVSGKWMILRKRRPRFVFCHRLTIFDSTLKDSFVLDVEDNYWILHDLSDPIASISDHKNQTIQSRRLCEDCKEQDGTIFDEIRPSIER